MTTTTATAPTSAGASTEATGATAGSPTATTEPAGPETPKSRVQRMEASIQRTREARSAPKAQPGNNVTMDTRRVPATDANAETQRPNPEDGKAGKASDDAKKAKEGKADSGAVPLAVFKERLAKVQEKASVRHQELQGQVNAKDLELANSREALKLLAAEFDGYKARVAAGELPDDRDEQLRGYELEKSAREAAQRNTKAHEDRIAGQARAQEEEQEKEQHAENVKSIAKEIDEVLTRYPMIHRRELIAEKHALQQATGQIVDTEKLAADLHERKLTIARSKLTAPTPATPQTARPEPVGTPVTRRVYNAKAYEARIGELSRQKSGG